MNKSEIIQEFWKDSDPLCRIALKTGLQKSSTNTIKLGLVIGLSSWGILILLSLIYNLGPLIFSLSVIGIHVRLLLAIPLFFVCETLVVPRMRQFISDLIDCGIVTGNDLPHLASRIQFSNRLRSAWIAECALLLFAYTMPFIGKSVGSFGGTGAWYDIFTGIQSHRTLAHSWYLWFCLPFFRFLVLRWMWHLFLWWSFLWSLRKVQLQLIPTHPDSTAGLGYLEVVYENFMPLVLAISAILSATYAENINRGTMDYNSLYLHIPIYLFFIISIFILPLLIFVRKLWICRFTGLSTYMDFASRYVNAFDRKWISNENKTSGPLLGTPDLQSLADLANSINIVRNMRVIPVGKRLLLVLAVSTIVPFLPLLFFKYRLDQLTIQFIIMLFGM